MVKLNLKVRNIIFLFTIIIFASLNVAFAQKSVKIPFEIVESGNRISIVIKNILVNNKKINLVFDTGASGSGINQQTIDELGLNPDAFANARGAGGNVKVPLFKNREIEISNTIYKMDLALFPLNGIKLEDGSETSGILGLGSFSNYYVMLDFNEMNLVVSETPFTNISSSNSVTLKSINDLSLVSFEGTLITVDGKEIKGSMYFDSGNPIPIIINQDLIDDHNFLIDKEKLEEITIAGIGEKKIPAYLDVLPEIKLGSYSLREIPMLIKEKNSYSHRACIANIGLPIIKKFNIIFNKNKTDIQLIKNYFFDDPIEMIKFKNNYTNTSELFGLIQEGNLEKLSEIFRTNENLKNVNVVNENGNTLLHAAIILGKNDIVKYLIRMKCDLNIKNEMNSATPLHLAVFKKNYEAVKMLLDAGANKEIKDIKGMTPLQMAEYFDIKNIQELLK